MKSQIVLCLGAALVPSALAAQEPSSDTVITVLANGTREPVANSGQAITVLGREAMDQVQGADVTRLIERVPGVSLSRNGGPGNFTAVRVRGAEAEQLLVLIDGVRAADTASPGGGFDFGNLLMGNLATIELQRSSNSTLWGSQALGGVLSVTTGARQGLNAAVEYGAHDSFYGTAGIGIAAGPASLNLQGGHFSSEGISAAASGDEPDGFRQNELVAHVAIDLARGLSAFATGRHADGRLELDGFPAPAFVLADTEEYQDTRQRSGAAGLQYDSAKVELRATASMADTERDSFDPALGPEPSFATDGTSERVDLRARWRFTDDLALDFGGEREWSRFGTTSDPVQRTAITGGYAQMDYDGGRFHLAAGLRRDQHRDFGGQWSLGADARYDLGLIQLTASYGEGFKAPTLFQLLSDYGNAALLPERSRSYDAGIGLDLGRAKVKATAFRRDTHDLIGFVSCFDASEPICDERPYGTYDNLDLTRSQGAELEAAFAATDSVALTAAYTFLDAKDRTPASVNEGNALPRRPRHALTATIDYTASTRLRGGADLRVVSRSFDDAANLVRIGGYEVLTLRGEWDASSHVTLFGRVENAWNERYQTAAGYAMPGRGLYLGARARF